MPRPLALLLALAVVAVPGCGGTQTVTTTVTVTAPQELASPPEQRLYGHIDSLRRAGDHYELGFDPAWFLSGETANAAAAEDGAVEPGQPVPNDNYALDEGHRVLDYRVPPSTAVTVITRHGNPEQLGATPIRVAELDRILHGTGTVTLFEPLDSGVWVTVRNDTVERIDQQYRP